MPSPLHRKLQHMPIKSWSTEESFETTNGVVPTISCPLGHYREYDSSSLKRPVGQRHDGCEPCPRGRYGSTTDLTTSLCSANCPRGRYRDTAGGTGLHDCDYCPEGTVGSKEGLTTRECSARCTDANTDTNRWYSDVVGLTRLRDCKECPQGYRGWQCDYELVPRLGTWTSDNGDINEAAHQYLMKGGDGRWSADKKEGDYAGAWPTHGAYPERAPIYPGVIAWDTKNEGFNYDPAKDSRNNVGVVPDV